MPYVRVSHRKKLDPYIQKVAGELAIEASNLRKPQEIGELYFRKFSEIVKLVRDKELGRKSTSGSSSEELAGAVFDAGVEDNSFWAGDLNYSLTRIIQLVPRKLVEEGKWATEFRYWIYAVTAGALERTALAADEWRTLNEKGRWIGNVLVGVLLDIKDEYKRRVNAPYEENQRTLNGDCYDVKM